MTAPAATQAPPRATAAPELEPAGAPARAALRPRQLRSASQRRRLTGPRRPRRCRRRGRRRGRERSMAGRCSVTPRTRPSSAARSGAAHADSIVRVMRLAGEAGAPVVGFVESGGARLQEGHAALAGYGRIFRASVELADRVPQISVVTGVSAGGGAYSPALTDFVVMTESARMFLTGPRVVEAALGERVSMEDLGGPGVHSRNGVCQLVARVRCRSRRRRPPAPRHAARKHRGSAAAGAAGARTRRGSGGGRSRRPAPRLRRPRSGSGDRRRRRAARALLELGAKHGHRVCADRRPARRADRQPAALPRRSDRCPGGGEGGALRQLLRALRPAARGPGRHTRLHAR